MKAARSRPYLFNKEVRKAVCVSNAASTAFLFLHSNQTLLINDISSMVRGTTWPEAEEPVVAGIAEGCPTACPCPCPCPCICACPCA